MGHGAGHFTTVASHAAIQPHEDLFGLIRHGIPSY
jgi:hypothetical protein